ncbi:hypothetical protein [Tolypothrix sp. VBCCA 56010]|uniref:hypothetical protein n=1 Tax=Tolypothrix sp. VBCCA 56010 TaxID=3137731 RepID=UPI003D7D67D5
MNNLTATEILKARDWLAECVNQGCWRNMENDDDVRNLSDQEVVNAIIRYYDYGIEGFKNDSADWDVYGNWKLGEHTNV